MNTKALDQHARMRRRIAKLRAEFEPDCQPPPGWITSQTFAKHLGTTQRRAYEVLLDWHDKGHCELKKYKTHTAQHYRFVIHYKLSPKVAKAYGLNFPK